MVYAAENASVLTIDIHLDPLLSMNSSARYKHALAFSCAAATVFVACKSPVSNQVTQSAQAQVHNTPNPDSIRLDRDCDQRDEHNQCTIYGPSLITLIARPELYDGKVVRVIGFVRFEFEGNALYVSQLDYENAVPRNGLWIDPPDGFQSFDGASKAQPNTQYVLVEATFNAEKRGHMGMWSGTLEHVSRLQAWHFPTVVRRIPDMHLEKMAPPPIPPRRPHP